MKQLCNKNRWMRHSFMMIVIMIIIITIYNLNVIGTTGVGEFGFVNDINWLKVAIKEKCTDQHSKAKYITLQTNTLLNSK